jgi:hypothetical protein
VLKNNRFEHTPKGRGLRINQALFEARDLQQEPFSILRMPLGSLNLFPFAALLAQRHRASAKDRSFLFKLPLQGFRHCPARLKVPDTCHDCSRRG